MHSIIPERMQFTEQNRNSRQLQKIFLSFVCVFQTLIYTQKLEIHNLLKTTLQSSFRYITHIYRDYQPRHPNSSKAELQKETHKFNNIQSTCIPMVYSFSNKLSILFFEFCNKEHKTRSLLSVGFRQAFFELTIFPTQALSSSSVKSQTNNKIPALACSSSSSSSCSPLQLLQSGKP